MQHWEAEAPNAIMGWTVFQPRREQWTRQRYESLRSRPQLENRAREVRALLRGQLPPGRTQELHHELLAAGVPL